MKIIIIGAVAAGTSAGAKARRNDEEAQITIYEKDKFISYSGCGMPYYIGDLVKDDTLLHPRDPKFFKTKYNIDVKTEHLVEKIDTEKKQVEVLNLTTGQKIIDSYDKLVIATGAKAFMPQFAGNDNAFTLRNINDAIKIKSYIMSQKPKSALIVGSGFIGLELLENFAQSGLEVNLVELADHITPILDSDMSKLLENKLKDKGVKIHTSLSLKELKGKVATLSNGVKIDSDLTVICAGIRPNVALAKSIGIEIGTTGAIKVDNNMETNIEGIYACGDCIETYNLITNKPVYRPLGSTANKTGRIAGDRMTGGKLSYKGNLGTGIFKVFDLTVATTGLNEKEALNAGFNVEICHNIKPDKPAYLGGEEMVIKAIADKDTGRLLGVQTMGTKGVDKRIDVFATLISYKAKVEELFHLDLAYAPPFSTTKDPVHYTGMILDNAINNGRHLITAKEISNIDENAVLIDVRSESDYKNKGCVKDAINIPQAKLREMSKTINKESTVVVYCNKGVTGNASQNILIGKGFKKVYNLSGGHRFYSEQKLK